MEIYITAVVKSIPEFRTEVQNFLRGLVEKTKKEEANITYNLHQDIKDENTFVFYEIWENQDGLDKHNEQPYMQTFRDLAAEKFQETIIYISKKIA